MLDARISVLHIEKAEQGSSGVDCGIVDESGQAGFGIKSGFIHNPFKKVSSSRIERLAGRPRRGWWRRGVAWFLALTSYIVGSPFFPASLVQAETSFASNVWARLIKNTLSINVHF